MTINIIYIIGSKVIGANIIGSGDIYQDSILDQDRDEILEEEIEFLQDEIEELRIENSFLKEEIETLHFILGWN